ncbi:DUF2510 domain-containing protein [Agromyces sp. NPDC055661]
MSDARTPAGWYPDGSGNLRYWDGNAWTEHTAPGPAAAVPGEATAAPADAASAGDTAVLSEETTWRESPTEVVPPVAPAASVHAGGVPPIPPAPDAPTQPYGPAAGQTQPYYAVTGAPVAVAEQPGAASSTKPHVLAIVALVVAAVGFIFACIPGVFIVGWVLLPIAFILSIVAFFLKGAKWPAITALALSVVGTIVGVVIFVVLVSGAFNQAVEEFDDAIAEASEAAETPLDQEEPAEEPDTAPVGNLAFGDTMVWEDDVELTVSAPVPYSPTEFAAGATLPNNIVFTMTITNNSTENLEPLPFAQLSSGGQEASQIFDITADGEDVGVPPTTVILPGESVTWRTAWSVADPASLTMQVAPSFAYEDAVFTNIP